MTSNKTSKHLKTSFAPGCALMLYKPELASKVLTLLNDNEGITAALLTCCQHDPQFIIPTQIINVCPGCNKRFEKDYQNTSTITLWEILATCDWFVFPDYQGKPMAILDACPTREKENVHFTIRTILRKMNISLVEPKNTRTKSTCCGDSFYGELPAEKIKGIMMKRASEMPVEDVVVYCISCINSIYIGGKKPRYLLDLLFSEDTVPKIWEPDAWHTELRSYIDKH